MTDERCRFENLGDLVIFTLEQLAKPHRSEELTRTILDALRECTGSSRTDLLIYQSEMNVLFFSATSIEESDTKKFGQINLADTKNSAAVKALMTSRPVYIPNVHESGLQSLSAGAHTVLAIPAIHGDRVHGVVNLENQKIDAYDTKTQKWIEAIANILSILLEKSWLSEQVFSLNQKIIHQMTESVSEPDPQYRAHAERVANIATAIAQSLGLPDETVNVVRDSGYLHDVGKSGIDKNILVKPGQLNPKEIAEVQKHPILGRFLLKPLGFQPAVIDAVASHHERWDGAGYPRGLSGESIPIAGRILAVAEAYDVMTSEQPYKTKMPPDKALKEIKFQAGKQFDPAVVAVLEHMDLSEL